MNEWTCIAGVAAALYMLHKIYIVVTVYVGDESGTLREKLVFVREMYTAVQDGWARAGAFVLGLAVLMKGTTKVLFITAGIRCARGVRSIYGQGNLRCMALVSIPMVNLTPE